MFFSTQERSKFAFRGVWTQSFSQDSHNMLKISLKPDSDVRTLNKPFLLKAVSFSFLWIIDVKKVLPLML